MKKLTCSVDRQMWSVIKNDLRSILFDTVEKTKEHSVHGKYLMNIYDADSAVQGSVNIIDGEYLAGAVAMSGIVTRKIKIVDNVYDSLRVTKSTGKPDFIVSPNGTTMPTNKDFNLVDSNKKGSDWFQIHNKHTDAKVNGSTHTHYPEQHGPAVHAR